MLLNVVVTVFIYFICFKDPMQCFYSIYSTQGFSNSFYVPKLQVPCLFHTLKYAELTAYLTVPQKFLFIL